MATDIFGFRSGAVILLASAVMTFHPSPSAAQMRSPAGAGGLVSADDTVTAGNGAPDGEGDARFVALGAGIGSPSGVTVNAAGYFAPVALRLSGGYWGSRWNGFQGDLGILFNSSPSFAHGISLIGGVFRTNPLLPNDSGAIQERDRIVHYVGAAYDMYLSGFFFQIGLAHGHGDYPDPQLAVQCGYLFAL